MLLVILVSLRGASASSTVLLERKNYFLIHNLIFIVLQHLVKCFLIILKWKVHVVVDISATMMLYSLLLARGAIPVKSSAIRLPNVLSNSHLFIVSWFIRQRHIILFHIASILSSIATHPLLIIICTYSLASLEGLLLGAGHTWLSLKYSVARGWVRVKVISSFGNVVLSLMKLLLSVGVDLQVLVLLCVISILLINLLSNHGLCSTSLGLCLVRWGWSLLHVWSCRIDCVRWLWFSTYLTDAALRHAGEMLLIALWVLFIIYCLLHWLIQVVEDVLPSAGEKITIS